MIPKRLVPDLPRAAWVVLVGDALSAVGSGLTLPFLIVYYHSIRGIDLSVAGFAVATIALAGFAGNPIGGWLADRIGARSALILGLVICSAGSGSVIAVHVAWQAFAASALVGLGAAIVWPAQDTLLANVVLPSQRSSVFSVRHATMNLGMAVGGLAAALIVDLHSASSFVLLYVVDAATFMLFVPILMSMRMPAIVDGAPPDDGDPVVERGLAEAVRDPAFRRLWVFTAVLVAVGFAQLNAAFPAYATRPGGLTAGALSIAMAGNTVVVFVCQLVALRFMAGRRRTNGLAITTLCWAAAWSIVVVSGGLGSGGGAVVALLLAAMVFGIGETFLSPSLAPLVNDLAPDDLRGRYNGLFTLAWTTGFALGPAIAGIALDAGAGALLFAGLAAVCVALAAGTRAIAPHLPAGTDLVPIEAAPEADLVTVR